MNAALREFGPGIWTSDGTVAPFRGFPCSTRMAAIRLSNGGLFIWSPIALSETLKREIDALRHPEGPQQVPIGFSNPTADNRPNRVIP